VTHLFAGEPPAVQWVDKPWGGEYIMRINNALMKVIRVDDGHRTSLQYHREKHEVHWLLNGTGTLEGSPDDIYGRPRPSPPYVMSPGSIHRAVGPLLIFEMSTNHPDDVVRLEDDYRR